jgi:hypothetical protein
MHDQDGPKITDIFYQHLFKNCDPYSNPPVLPDLTGAAEALHLAVEGSTRNPASHSNAGFHLRIMGCNTICISPLNVIAIAVTFGVNSILSPPIP